MKGYIKGLEKRRDDQETSRMSPEYRNHINAQSRSQVPSHLLLTQGMTSKEKVSRDQSPSDSMAFVPEITVNALQQHDMLTQSRTDLEARKRLYLNRTGQKSIMNQQNDVFLSQVNTTSIIT